MNTPCDTIDTDYGFYLPKNMLCGSVEMSKKAPRLGDLLGIYRSPNAALEGSREGKSVQEPRQNTSAAAYFTSSKK